MGFLLSVSMCARWISISNLFNYHACRRNFCSKVFKSNPFYDKYAVKIEEIQKTSPKDFQSLLKKNYKKHGSEIKNVTCQSNEYSRPKTTGSHSLSLKTLNQIMKLDLLQEKAAEDIELIWKNYHKEKDGLYSVLPNDAYEKMHSMFLEYPTFLFPLPRAQGFEFIMCQFESNSWHFTSLLNYQAFKENAPICLTVTYFTELSKDKGIVLMRGEFNEDELKIPEAQCLANQLQLYYSGKDEKKEKLLWHFNRQPLTFKHMDLISELEYV